MTELHFVDAKTRHAIRARILELHASHGDAAFRMPGVQKAMALLVDADVAPQAAVLRAAVAERRAKLGDAERRVVDGFRPLAFDRS
jgi:hypothetical protein